MGVGAMSTRVLILNTTHKVYRLKAIVTADEGLLLDITNIMETSEHAGKQIVLMLSPEGRHALKRHLMTSEELGEQQPDAATRRHARKAGVHLLLTQDAQMEEPAQGKEKPDGQGQQNSGSDS